jgi:hypothetical protein
LTLVVDDGAEIDAAGDAASRGQELASLDTFFSGA